MNDFLSKPCTAFVKQRILASGALIDVALAVKAAVARDAEAGILTFDNRTGAVIDLDLRGTTADVVSRLTAQATRAAARAKPKPEEGTQRGRGRPRLGVIAREVTLLPRHWEWLAAQPGGASGTLRRLVEEARRGDGGQTNRRAAQEAAYRFMSAMAGDLAGFEEATRALFANDAGRFDEQTADWPQDVRTYARDLAFGASLA